MTGDTESWPGEWEHLAQMARMDRERRLSQGWHRAGWKDPASLLRSLDDQYADPSEVRQLAYDRQRERAAAAPVYADDDAWAPMMDRYLDALGVRAPRHERGWPA